MMQTTELEKFGLTFEVDYEYEPAVPPINHPSSAGQPGEPATVTVVRVLLVPEHPERDETRRDITEMVEALGNFPFFEALVLEQVQ